jgi:S-formylglutathione hydrolase
MAELTMLSSAKCFDGMVKKYSHKSQVLQCTMKFTVFVPPQAQSQKVPVLYWLSGLTCTDENFITKAGAQRAAAKYGIFLVCTDTSARGVQIEGQDDSYDFGSGAGFYLTATEEKWKAHYNMYDYITKEIPDLINANFPVHPDKQSISGHSMGGHGALICSLKNPGKYKSVSAFSPICNPINCPWGIKAFTGYLGSDKETWKAWDATELIKSYNGPDLHLLIDQGLEDGFYKEKQLLTENFKEVCKQSLQLRMLEGYDHSYYFILTFIDDHIKHHAKALYGEPSSKRAKH